MKIKKQNIGECIERKLIELGISKSEFGRKIGIPQQNVNRLLDRPSIDTDKLVVISETLNYNFFRDYIDDSPTSINIEGNYNQFNDVGAHNNIIAPNDMLLIEKIKHLEERLKDKEEIIKLLKSERL